MEKEIEDYILNNFDCFKENPWKDTPEFTTFKRKNNKKWFGLIMNIPYERFKINKDENVYVINLKCDPEFIGSLRKVYGIYPAYHMNKEHWISVLLDGSISKNKIIELIKISYDLTNNKRRCNLYEN